MTFHHKIPRNIRKNKEEDIHIPKLSEKSITIPLYIPISHNLSEPNMKYTYLHFPQESKKYIDKVMVWSLFFLLGFEQSWIVVLDWAKHVVFLVGFHGNSHDFWICWIGMFSSLFFPDWETMETSMEKNMEQYLWFFLLVLHMSRIFMVLDGFVCYGFGIGMFPSLFGKRWNHTGKNMKQVMEYAHGSFRFFGMFFLHWCFHVFLNQGRTTRRSISTPKPEQTSSSTTTRMPTNCHMFFP